MQLRIITTGGTIDKVYFDAKSEYAVGEPQIDQILAEAQVGFEYVVQPLMQKDSLELDDTDRECIVDAVRAAPEQHIIITHGTDTMTDTARCLEDVTGKTVVLTGSLSPARFRGSDAILNIGAAVAAVQCMPSGVYIAMNGCVFVSGSVVKDRDLNRFEPL